MGHFNVATANLKIIAVFSNLILSASIFDHLSLVAHQDIKIYEVAQINSEENTRMAADKI